MCMHGPHSTPRWARRAAPRAALRAVRAAPARQDATALLIANRSGGVLGAHTLLKEDHFPGCQSAKLALTVPGAPNFRGVPGQRVFGAALPTLEGICGGLPCAGCAPGGAGAHGEQARRAPPRGRAWRAGAGVRACAGCASGLTRGPLTCRLLGSAHAPSGCAAVVRGVPAARRLMQQRRALS